MITSPLKNKKIVLTRSEEKSRELAKQIEVRGGMPIIMPLIEFRPAFLSNTEKQLLTQLEQIDWLIFTSTNGVHYFFQALHTLHIKLSNKVKLAVVGTKTKEALKKKGYHPAVIPKEFTAEGLVDTFQTLSIQNKTMIYVKGNLARDVIPTELRKQGAEVHELMIYETYCPAKRDDYLLLLQEKIDAITFTSPSTIHHFVQLLEGENWRDWLNQAVVCCIGPVTEIAARDVGIIPTIVPTTYTMTELINELSLYFQKEGE